MDKTRYLNGMIWLQNYIEWCCSPKWVVWLTLLNRQLHLYWRFEIDWRWNRSKNHCFLFCWAPYDKHLFENQSHRWYYITEFPFRLFIPVSKSQNQFIIHGTIWGNNCDSVSQSASPFCNLLRLIFSIPSRHSSAHTAWHTYTHTHTQADTQRTKTNWHLMSLKQSENWRGAEVVCKITVGPQ